MVYGPSRGGGRRASGIRRPSGSLAQAVGLLAALLVAMPLIGVVQLPTARAAASREEVVGKILLRALGYDRKLKTRFGKELTLGLVYSSGAAQSREAKAKMEPVFRRLSALRIDGLPIRLVLLDLSDPSVVEKRFADTEVGVVYVTRGMAVFVAAIKAASRKLKVATLTGAAGFVRAGLSVGVSFHKGRPKLLVNLAASRQEGMDLSARLLAVATVIR